MSIERKVGKSLDEKIKKIVQSESLAFCVTVRKNKIVLTGNENVVNVVMQTPGISVAELWNKMLNDFEVSSVFSSSSPLIFPKFPVKFLGENWTFDLARDQLQNIMHVLGFGHGGTKKYTILQDKPDGGRQ